MSMSWIIFALGAVGVAFGIGYENPDIAILGLSFKLTGIFIELTERRP